MNAPNTLRELLPAGVQGQELIHESAHLHVTGEAVYTDDIPELRGTLYAALVKSPVAHGELIGEGIDRAALLAEHGVVAVFTAWLMSLKVRSAAMRCSPRRFSNGPAPSAVSLR
jgi:xanthine dehydrogenase large subunit